MINVSIGTAAVMGLVKARLKARPTTAYLMLGGRCLMDCAFCAQARSSTANPELLSRVKWPPFKEEEVLSHLKLAVLRGDFKRVCLQVTVTKDYLSRTIELAQRIKEQCDVPVDAAILPSDFEDVKALLAAGVEHIGFGLDAVSERIFRETKGPHWDRIIGLIEQTAHRFPGRVAVHLIIGLGETEKEAAFMIQKMHDLKVITGLFAFTPIPGTKMESCAPPPLASYRRIQVARWLITQGLARAEDFTYSSDGTIIAFEPDYWEEAVADGRAFMTSGCPDCNRPYYNERPTGPLYNFPYLPSAEEIEQAINATRNG
ncbi:MAG: radical SAM protein [Chloroflexi bacterium]|nr:MAG: radical SAM protein [Chloroflexota bacterium]